MLGLKLDSLAKNISKTKSWYVRQMIEDNIDDYKLACLALQAKEDKLFRVEDSLSLGKPLVGNFKGLYRWRVGDFIDDRILVILK